MTKENEFIKTFEEWYEWWFNKPFPTDKEEAEKLKANYDLQVIYKYCCKRKTSLEKEVENLKGFISDSLFPSRRHQGYFQKVKTTD